MKDWLLSNLVCFNLDYIMNKDWVGKLEEGL